MRDRLIKLLDQKISTLELEDCDSVWTSEKLDELADYLLDSGVIVPPCKLHDEVWFIAKRQGDDEFKVFYGHARCIDLRNGWKHVIIDWTDYQDSYKYVAVFEDFGKTIFLTEAEAVKALENLTRVYN